MIKRKPIRERGKVRLRDYFRKFEIGERVSVKRELSVQPKFPKALQGRTGLIDGKRGSCYIVKIKDFDKEKKYIIHLRTRMLNDFFLRLV